MTSAAILASVRDASKRVIGPAPVRPEYALEYAAPAFLDLGEDHRAGPVPEEDAGGAVRPVRDPGQGLGADDQRVLALPRLEHAGGDLQRVDEARAARPHVEGGAAVGAYFVLDDAGGGRETEEIGGGGGHDDEIQLLWAYSRIFQG